MMHDNSSKEDDYDNPHDNNNIKHNCKNLTEAVTLLQKYEIKLTTNHQGRVPADFHSKDPPRKDGLK